MKEDSVYENDFLGSDERRISSIGAGYTADYKAKGKSGLLGATLTNKRVYFSGLFYTRNISGRYVLCKQRKIINIRDITGTGYDFCRPKQNIWLSIVFFLLAAVGSFIVIMYVPESMSYISNILLFVSGAIPLGISILFICIYFAGKKTLFTIDYTGGNIAFNAKKIGPDEQNDFMRYIHHVKDALYSMVADNQGFSAGAADSNEIARRRQMLIETHAGGNHAANYDETNAASQMEGNAALNSLERELAEARNNKIYDEAVSLMDKADSGRDFRRAAEMLASIAGYKDAAQLSELCIEKEIEETEKAYQEAVTIMNGARTHYDFTEASKQFAQVIGHKNAGALYEYCKNEGMRLMEMRVAKDDRMRAIKKKLLLAIISFLVVAAVIVFVYWKL